MPKVRWGIDASIIDEWDRSSQYKPYTGPTPPNAVYQWRIKVLKYAAATNEKHPQLRIGLELVPRESNRDEKRYRDFFVMEFRSIAPTNAFAYAPFLDAIGVSSAEFTQSTITDREGNVTKIGRWRNTGDTLIMGQLVDRDDQNGKSRKAIDWMGAVEEPDEYGDDEYDEEIDEEYDDDDDDGEAF